MIWDSATKYLHEASGEMPPIPQNPSEWPLAWKQIVFKEYPRFPQVILPPPRLSTSPFDTILMARKSARSFVNLSTLSNYALSNILHLGAGISHGSSNSSFSSRYYPSGGGRYPLELYVSFRGNETTERGTYHYNVARHTLEQLSGADGDDAIRSLPSYPWVKDAALIGIISFVYQRTTQKYGHRGYRFGLIEAGAMLHNFYIAASMENFGCCGIGVNNDLAISNILDLNDDEEGVLLNFALGPFVSSTDMVNESVYE